jgi:hypothetical protein
VTGAYNALMSLTGSGPFPATAVSPDLWRLVLESSHIEPLQLASAIERQVANGDLDFRSRLLIRDALHALAARLGQHKMAEWFDASSMGHRFTAILAEDLGPAGFPFLREQLMNVTKSETVMELLRELSLHIRQPTQLVIGGSIALILSGRLTRHTQDIDVVDEIPATIRDQHELLKRLASRYQLRLTHFQSPYLPTGWEQRIKSLDRFGTLNVQLVDELDVMLSKLFSDREKDRDDLRVVAASMPRERLVGRLQTAGAALLNEPRLRRNAADNWFIIYGEPLPVIGR